MDNKNGSTKYLFSIIAYVLILSVLAFALPVIPPLLSGTPNSTYSQWTILPMYGGGAIMSVAVDPTSPNIVYAAADLSGPYKSTDYGNSWKSIRTGLRTEADWDTSAIAINPSNHNQIFIGTGQAYGTPSPGDNYGGLFRSDDGGSTWHLVTRTLKFSGHGDVRQTGDGLILFDKNNNSIMYAATIWDGIFKSTDGGKTWANKGLSGKCLTGMAINSNGTIFASALLRGTTSGGIFKSTDGGSTWTTLSTVSTEKLVVNGNTIYASVPGTGIYKSIDGGATWTTKNTGISAASINALSGLAMDQSNPNILYTVSNVWSSPFQSLYKTTNGGDTWVSIPAGASSITINNLWNPSTSMFSSGSWSLTIDPTNSNQVYLADSYTVWGSHDGGANWYTNAQGLETTVTAVIKAHPSIPGLVIAGTNDVTGLITTNGGATVKHLYSYLPGNIADSNIWGVGYIKTDTTLSSATIYVSTGKSTGAGYLWKSIDGGSTWNLLSNLPSAGEKKAVAVDQKNPNIIYVSSKYNYMYKSTDAGNTWTQLTTGLSATSDIRRIVIDPVNTNNLYILDTTTGIYKSTDSGSTWSLANNGLTTGNDFNCLAIDPNHANVLYAGGQPNSQNYGLFKSVNSGSTWTPLFKNFSCGNIVVSPINSAIFAGGMAEWFYTSQTGVYVSRDGGGNWSSIGDLVSNIPLPYIKAVEEDPFNPGTLYVGTEGGGIYKYTPGIIYPKNTTITPAGAGPAVAAGSAGARSVIITIGGRVKEIK